MDQLATRVFPENNGTFRIDGLHVLNENTVYANLAPTPMDVEEASFRMAVILHQNADARNSNADPAV